jgi:hypothetical protein
VNIHEIHSFYIIGLSKRKADTMGQKR